MEKFFFKKIELWAVLLLAVLGFVAAVIFAAIVRNVALGFDRYGVLGEIAYSIASVPADAKTLLRQNENPDSNGMSVPDAGRFDTRSGWSVEPSTTLKPLDGYLLFSRYDGDFQQHTIELFDLSTQKVEHRVEIDADLLFKNVDPENNILSLNDWNTARFRAIHPVVLQNGDLLIKNHHSPMFRINACGGLIWDLQYPFHHSSEIGPNGDLWTTAQVHPTQIEGLSETYRDDSIIRVSIDGDVGYHQSLTEVMLNQGYGNLLFSNGKFDEDPIHLNDVQPVLSDGPFWQKGDVFLSLRHLSMIILFRPSTNQIVWMKQGPWAGQHDVDVIDDHTIAVFNNNMFNMGDQEFVEGTSEILFYDFVTDTVSSPYKDIFENHEIRTATEGLFTLLENGHLLVEESDAGRLLIFSPDGTLVAENVNRAENGLVYHLGWSRYIERDLGDQIRSAMNEQSCN